MTNPKSSNLSKLQEMLKMDSSTISGEFYQKDDLFLTIPQFQILLGACGDPIRQLKNSYEFELPMEAVETNALLKLIVETKQASNRVIVKPITTGSMQEKLEYGRGFQIANLNLHNVTTCDYDDKEDKVIKQTKAVGYLWKLVAFDNSLAN